MTAIVVSPRFVYVLAVDSQARIETARALLAERRSSLVRKAASGPPCTRCRFYSYPQFQTGMPGLCRHPAFEVHDFDVTTGRLSVAHETPAKAARDDLCGPEAVLFERRPVSLKTVALAVAVAAAPGYYIFGALYLSLF